MRCSRVTQFRPERCCSSLVVSVLCSMCNDPVQYEGSHLDCKTDSECLISWMKVTLAKVIGAPAEDRADYALRMLAILYDVNLFDYINNDFLNQGEVCTPFFSVHHLSSLTDACPTTPLAVPFFCSELVLPNYGF